MTASTATEAPDATPAAPRTSFLTRGVARLDSRDNGLNLIRLVLAYTVLVAHSYYIAGVGVGPHVNGHNLGGWAVMGFFAISGYLITGSRLTKRLGHFLVLRIARIYPAFVVCLVVTAGVLAPATYLVERGTLDGFATTPTTPLVYLIGNGGLRVGAYDVAGTPASVPYPAVWNGSLWTLYYEFLCYLLVAALMVIPWCRRRPWGAALALAATTGAYALLPVISPYVSDHADVRLLLQLAPFFFAGSLLYMLRDRLPLTWPLALVSVVAGVAAGVLVPGWGPQLAALPLAYALLWFGAVLPSPRLVRRHDVSYGVYVYGWPTQQVLVLAGAHHLGLAAYNAIAAVLVLVPATLSWLFVERPVLRRARAVTREDAPWPVPPAVGVPSHEAAPTATTTGTSPATDRA